MPRPKPELDPLDYRQGFGRHFEEYTGSGLTMDQEIEHRLRTGPHAAYVNSLLGTNRASPMKMRQLMRRLESKALI